MKRENILVHLLAFAGTGKLTIARALCNSLDAILIDSHLINNPVFRVFKADGITRLPPSVWDLTNKIRHVVFEAIETQAGSGENYIFTNVMYANDPDDEKNLAEMLAFCKKANLTYVPIRLICAEEELLKRRVAPGRKENLKDISLERALTDLRKRSLLHTGKATECTLDVTTLSPEGAAEKILAHIDSAVLKKAA